MIDVLERFSTGFLAPARGLLMIAGSDSLQRRALIPMVITIVVLVGGGVLALSWLWHLVPSMSLDLARWVAPALAGALLTSLHVLFMIMIWPAVVIALAYVLLLLAKIVGAPFHSLLAEQALTEGGLIVARPFRLGAWLHTASKMFVVSFFKSVLFLVLGACLLVFSLIPVFNVVAILGSLLLVTFDLCDYSFEVLEWSLHERVRFFSSNLVELTGLAFAMGLILMVPVVNLFVLPAAIVGTSDVIRRLLKAS